LFIKIECGSELKAAHKTFFEIKKGPKTIM